MFRASPRQARAAYLARLRQAIQCVARAEVVGSGLAPDERHGITVLPHGRTATDLIPLYTSDRQADFLLRVRESYVLDVHPDRGDRVRYGVKTVSYAYAICDRDERELLAYHWHPEGVSDVTVPHLHIPRIPPMPLPRTDPTREVALGEMHLPTNYVHLEDIVELLIREFAIVPLRADWQATLAESRSELDRER